MIRAVLALVVPCLAVGLAAVWMLGPPQRLDARFRMDDCRQVLLVDPSTGREIVGAEDIVLAPDGDTLILSAHDRLGTTGVEGGLYALSLFGLGGAGERAMPRPLPALGQAGGPFRPHGIALSADGTRLALVNRVSRGQAVVEVGTLTPDGWRPDRRIANPRLCRANDVDFADGPARARGPSASGAVSGGPSGMAPGLRYATVPEADAEVLRVTLDRADCAISLRDLLGGSGSVARIDGDRLTVETGGLNFPNGIDGGWIAETRAHRLLGPGGPVAMPGGPDNIGLNEGSVIAALHPNLVRTGLYVGGWLDRLSSRIVAVDARSGAVEVLYDDPEGAQFSGATIGVLAGGRLVAGSVRAAGILYCESASGGRG